MLTSCIFLPYYFPWWQMPNSLSSLVLDHPLALLKHTQSIIRLWYCWFLTTYYFFSRDIQITMQPTLSWNSLKQHCVNSTGPNYNYRVKIVQKLMAKKNFFVHNFAFLEFRNRDSTEVADTNKAQKVWRERTYLCKRKRNCLAPGNLQRCLNYIRWHFTYPIGSKFGKAYYWLKFAQLDFN